MDIITLREYSRRVGVSLTAVQKAIQNGRITAVTDPETGRCKGIDWTTQAEAWTANSKHPQKKAHTAAGGRPRKDGQPTAPAQQRVPDAPREGDVSEYLEAQPHGGSLKRAQTEPAPAGEMTLAQIQRARELVKLQIDNEKLKEVRGTTVPAADVEKQGRSLASIVVGAVYNIADRISDELAGMNDPHQIHTLLLQEFDRAVDELRRAYA